MSLRVEHLDAVFGELLIISRQLGNIERRQQRLARRLTWLIHEVRVAFEAGARERNRERSCRKRHSTGEESRAMTGTRNGQVTRAMQELNVAPESVADAVVCRSGEVVLVLKQFADRELVSAAGGGELAGATEFGGALGGRGACRAASL